MAWSACDQEQGARKQTQGHPTAVLFYSDEHKAHQNSDVKATFFFCSQEKKIYIVNCKETKSSTIHLMYAWDC